MEAMELQMVIKLREVQAEHMLVMVEVMEVREAVQFIIMVVAVVVLADMVVMEDQEQLQVETLGLEVEVVLEDQAHIMGIVLALVEEGLEFLD